MPIPSTKVLRRNDHVIRRSHPGFNNAHERHLGLQMKNDKTGYSLILSAARIGIPAARPEACRLGGVLGAGQVVAHAVFLAHLMGMAPPHPPVARPAAAWIPVPSRARERAVAARSTHGPERSCIHSLLRFGPRTFLCFRLKTFYSYSYRNISKHD